MPGYKDLEKYLFGCDHATAVTPSDTVDLANFSRRLYVGGTGNVKVDTVGGETLTFNSVPVGYLDVHARRVYSTGTTATNIVALW